MFEPKQELCVSRESLPIIVFPWFSRKFSLRTFSCPGCLQGWEAGERSQSQSGQVWRDHLQVGFCQNKDHPPGPLGRAESAAAALRSADWGEEQAHQWVAAGGSRNAVVELEKAGFTIISSSSSLSLALRFFFAGGNGSFSSTGSADTFPASADLHFCLQIALANGPTTWC